MTVLKLMFLVLMLSDCYHNTKAMGLCDFADKFPCEDNGGSVCFKNTGCHQKVPDKRQPPSQHTTKQFATGHSTLAFASTDGGLLAKSTTEKVSSVHVTTVNKTNEVTTGPATIYQETTDQKTAGHETTDDVTTTTSSCPPNMVYANCTTCQGTCIDPNSCISNCTEPETCVCHEGFLLKGDDCVSEEECECFIEGEGVIPAHATYVDENCSERCECADGLLNCNSNYKCSLTATCREEDGVRQCYCNDGYIGDGETCTLQYKDCYDVYQAGRREDGIYIILPSGWQGTPFNVSCDMTSPGGGWTIFQRRSGVSNFNRNWTSYKYGFGFLGEGEDFWLGNEQLFYLTNQRYYKLRIDIIGLDGAPYYAEYSVFRIDDESTNYRVVAIGNHTGDTGNGMDDVSDAVFSTYDRDNDECDNHNCAERHRGGWWHNPKYMNRCSNCWDSSGCRRFKFSPVCYGMCTTSNLNGIYNGISGQNINWFRFFFCNPIFVEMKIRPDL